MRKNKILLIVLCITLAHVALARNRGLKGYALTCDRSLPQRASQIAASEVGVVELLPNDSPEIKEYLLSVGLRKPASYCAAGIYWSFEQAKAKLKLTNNPLPRTAIANAMFNHAKEEGTPIYCAPSKGDLLVWRRANSWQGHIEIVHRVLNHWKIETIGYNTKRPQPDTSGHRPEGVWKQIRIPFHPLGRLKYRGMIFLGRNLWK